jgi:superfamily I DNA/RNA helicase
MQYTPQQELILAEVTDLVKAQNSVLIEARAGAGKTFILTQLAPFLPLGGHCLAFNKAIAEELDTKLPGSCLAKTFHALGFSLLRERLQTVDMKMNKLYTLAKTKLKVQNTKPYTELVSAMKIAGMGLRDLPSPTLKNIDHLIDTRNIEVPENITREEFITQTIKLFKASLKQINVIDFDDMLYLPLYLADKFGWSFDKFKFLMIDEAQDVSPLRLEMIKRLTDTVIAVGDPYQSIYGFAGAANGALNEIETCYQTERYQLPHSFRCPSNITQEASELIYPDSILSLPENLGGVVTRQKFNPTWYPTSESQTVLCRMNAPLFVTALRMLRDGAAFNFNSDFPRQLISFQKRFKATTCKELQVRVTAWFEEESERLAGRKGPLSLAKEKHDTLMYLATQCEDPKTITLTLEKLMTPNPGHPTLSTIHKAKGLEWPEVYLIRPDLLPAPFASTPEELEQERNLEYVAMTRASQKFTYLDK